MKTFLHLWFHWLHPLLMRVSWYEQRYNAYLCLVADGQYLQDLLAHDGPINDDYCWVHYPGGWTCPLCRESEVQA